MSFTLPIHEPQPSQLLVDAERLRGVIGWYDFDEPEYEPIPVIELADDLVLSDGHTRALLAYLAGSDELEVVYHQARPSLDIDLYRHCVAWCREEAVTTAADLVGRVVSRERFLDDWVARCDAASEG